MVLLIYTHTHIKHSQCPRRVAWQITDYSHSLSVFLVLHTCSTVWTLFITYQTVALYIIYGII